MIPSPYPRNNFNTELSQPCMNGEHFSLFIEISPIRSKKTIMALKEYLVDGYSKQESC
ncbi:TPA: transcriptional regulator, partial [Escherichia coli]|nr:transcriptional regulator [Escherichia coli]